MNSIFILFLLYREFGSRRSQELKKNREKKGKKFRVGVGEIIALAWGSIRRRSWFWGLQRSWELQEGERRKPKKGERELTEGKAFASSLSGERKKSRVQASF